MVLGEEGLSLDPRRKMGETAGSSDHLGKWRALTYPFQLATSWRAVQRMRKTVGCRDALDGGGEQDRGAQAGTVQFTRGPRRAFKSKKGLIV